MPAEVSGNGSRPSDAAADGGIGIHLKNISKRFGELVVLRGIDFEIPRHSRIGIVGPSGGGKTTLLQIIAGLLEADDGPGPGRGRHHGAAAARALRADAAAGPAAALADRAGQCRDRAAEPRGLPGRRPSAHPAAVRAAGTGRASRGPGPVSCPAACGSG